MWVPLFMSDLFSLYGRPLYNYCPTGLNFGYFEVDGAHFSRK